MTNADKILAAIRSSAGLTDSDLRTRTGVQPHQQVNQICRKLEAQGFVDRRMRPDGRIGNWPRESKTTLYRPSVVSAQNGMTTNVVVPVPRDASKSSRPRLRIKPDETPISDGSQQGSGSNAENRRLLAGHEFDWVGRIEPIKDLDEGIRQFMPQARYARASSMPLNRHGAGPFCRFPAPTHRTEAGVYALTVDSKLTYIGECENLTGRFGQRGYGAIQPRNCYVGGQSTNCKINHAILVAATADMLIDLWFLPSNQGRAIETRLIAQLQPPWNG